MRDKDFFESNRAAWNQAAAYHQKAQGQALRDHFQDPSFTVFRRERDAALNERLRQLDLRSKTIAHIPCNNGRELLSLMRLGAQAGVGFDISDAAIAQARELAAAAQANAQFVRTNALEISADYDGAFDFIYVSQGSLQWFPKLQAFFQVIARLLKPGGQALLFEIHPCKYFFENGFRFQLQNFDQLTSYFDSQAHHYPQGLDYLGHETYDAAECFWFMHPMSEIITGLLRNGLAIQDFAEFPFDLDGDAPPEVEGKFPFSYLITVKKA